MRVSFKISTYTLPSLPHVDARARKQKAESRKQRKQACKQKQTAKPFQALWCRWKRLTIVGTAVGQSSIDGACVVWCGVVWCGVCVNSRDKVRASALKTQAHACLQSPTTIAIQRHTHTHTHTHTGTHRHTETQTKTQAASLLHMPRPPPPITLLLLQTCPRGNIQPAPRLLGLVLKRCGGVDACHLDRVAARLLHLPE